MVRATSDSSPRNRYNKAMDGPITRAEMVELLGSLKAELKTELKADLRAQLTQQLAAQEVGLRTEMAELLAIQKTQLRAELGEQLATQKVELRTEMAELLTIQKAELRIEMAELFAIQKREIFDIVQEQVRDAQTEILKAFLPYQESSNIRLQVIEAKITNTDVALTTRMRIMEARLQQIEKKLLLDPPAA